MRRREICSYLKIDRYAILMIPSSQIAFQVIIAIVGSMSLVTFGLTAYLLAFHIFLSELKKKKTTTNKHMNIFPLCQGYSRISTYDYVISRRHDQTVNETVLQFNQLNQNPPVKTGFLSRFVNFY